MSPSPARAGGCGPGLRTGAADMDEHVWVWDEDSNGAWYRFCTRCGRYEADCQPNEFHPWVACDKPRTKPTASLAPGK